MASPKVLAIRQAKATEATQQGQAETAQAVADLTARIGRLEEAIVALQEAIVLNAAGVIEAVNRNAEQKKGK